jgi:hypothetical protein
VITWLACPRLAVAQLLRAHDAIVAASDYGEVARAFAMRAREKPS